MAADSPDISSHDTDYVEYVGPGLTWGWILSTCVISARSNDPKRKYMFMFPLKNIARIELRWCWYCSNTSSQVSYGEPIATTVKPLCNDHLHNKIYHL